jgi:HAD superfamily phosphatase (TIGR01668 family)
MCKLFKLKSYLPIDCQKTIFDIDYTKLYENGRKIILLDLDNTLIPYDTKTPNEKHVNFFQELKTIGFRVVIISNNHQPRVHQFASLVGCEYINSALKPLKRGYKKALKLLSFPAKHEIIAIGDQIMTDVLGSSRVGIDCILVKPIKKKSEKWYTKVNRMLEKSILNRINKRYPEIYQKIKQLEEE